MKYLSNAFSTCLVIPSRLLIGFIAMPPNTIGYVYTFFQSMLYYYNGTGPKLYCKVLSALYERVCFWKNVFEIKPKCFIWMEWYDGGQLAVGKCCSPVTGTRSGEGGDRCPEIQEFKPSHVPKGFMCNHLLLWALAWSTN
jgi:hypothetical protein